MADITLSKAVRSNLLNLQSTASQLGKTQQRLATGLKVNSALDNPTNFFTASSLNSRAGDLGRLLDAVGNATQTIEAANNGLSAITKLVESAQATARQALQTTGAVTSNKITGSTSATYNPQALSTVVGDNSANGALAADAVATVDTLDLGADTAITMTGATQFAHVSSGTVSADLANIASIVSIDLDTGATDGLGTLGEASPDGPALTNGESISLTVDGTKYTVNFDATSAAGAARSANGSDWEITVGVNQTTASLTGTLNTLLDGSGVTVSGTDTLTFAFDNTVDSVVVADGAGDGTTLTKLGLHQGGAGVTGESDLTATAGTTGDYLLTKNADIQALAAAGSVLTIDNGTGGVTTTSVTFGTGAGEVNNMLQLVSALDGLANISATANGTTGFNVTGLTQGNSITFGGSAAATALGLSTNAYEASASSLSSIGVSASDSLVFSVDGTDYTVNFDANSAASTTSNVMTIGVDKSLAQFASGLNAAFNGAATATIADDGSLTIASGTADSIRITDATGTNTAELGLDAVGTAYTAGAAVGGTADRLVTSNATIQALAARGATLDVSVGGTAQAQVTFGIGTGDVANRADLLTALNGLADITATTSGSVTNGINLTNSTATDTKGNIVLTGDSANTLSTLGFNADSGTPTISTTKPQNLLNRGYVNQGETLDIKVGNSATLTVTFGTGTGEVSTFGELNAKLENLAAGAASVNTTNGNISITSDKGGDNISVGGTASVLTNFGLTEGEFGNLVDSGVGIADGDKLNIQIGTNTLKTITFGTGTGQVNTLSELESALGSIAGGSVSIDTKTGAISISATNGADSITVTSTNSSDVSKDAVASAFGLSNSTTAVTSKTVDSAQRETLEAQFNDLLTQINQLSADASFNGVNLLGGNDLNVIFNEDSTSKLDIRGVTFNASGLGLSRSASGAFQTDTNINDTLTSLDNAITSLRSQATTFGSNLSVVETRQNFTKEMINTLETGASNLTLADTNEEAANLLALQTRQQLSSTALSLASQSDQNVLRLF